MVVALIHSGEVNLTRWLNNARINVHRLYKPLIQAALADWEEDCLYLSLDTSLFWEEYCLIRLAVVYRGRALPVAWRVLHHRSAMVSYVDYQAVLQQTACCLPKGVKVILLADRGFVHTDLMRALTKQWHWHYRIRLKNDTWVGRKGKGWTQLKDFHCKHGEALCFHNVYLHKEHWYGPVHIAFGRNNVNGEFWAIVSDEPTTLQTFFEYGLRFDIEEAFLNDQSNGWNIQKSEIRSVCVLSRLWFILALATLYVTAQGTQVVEAGKRRWVDAHWFRGNSYFTGWDWVKTALHNGWQLIRWVRFTANRDPVPVISSRQQYEKRTYRLEFKVSTFQYSPEPWGTD